MKKKHSESGKRIALVGAELEENLALRYMASSLDAAGHQVEIVEFNDRNDLPGGVRRVVEMNPDMVGLSMIFTARAGEFCSFAARLRESGYEGHLVAGGPFAAFNAELLLSTYNAFDSVALGEGEHLIVELARNLDALGTVRGLCYRTADGTVATNAPRPNPEDLDALPFPRRTKFHAYFDKPIASILSSRGCWRSCAFCSINAWYRKSGGKRFRTRSIANIVDEMRTLYFDHDVRIFNFQDDNFFLPDKEATVRRFDDLRRSLHAEGVTDIAVAVKARPDSITREAVAILDDLKLFRVFLGVENASENGLRNLNRKNTIDEILQALAILNDYDVHLAYNLLMFEPHTTMDDLLVNLRFMERHIENPFNFCRAEAYPGTGLETILKKEGILEGDWFGYDYHLLNPGPEAFHQIANYAFFDRNFNNNGLHYFNMQVDFYYQLLRRFHPGLLIQKTRAATRNFIKQTNLDTYECLSEIFDFVQGLRCYDSRTQRTFARKMREEVDARSERLYREGSSLLHALEGTYDRHRRSETMRIQGQECRVSAPGTGTYADCRNASSLVSNNHPRFEDPFGLSSDVLPYDTFNRYRKSLVEG